MQPDDEVAGSPGPERELAQRAEASAQAVDDAVSEAELLLEQSGRSLEQARLVLDRFYPHHKATTEEQMRPAREPNK